MESNIVQFLRKLLVLFTFGFIIQPSLAQDDLLDLLEAESEPVTNYTFATFKTTRIVSGHSIETNDHGVMQFLIGHRFGRVNAGWRELFGLDNATIRIGLEYGITKNLNIGFGRSSFTKIYDGFLKYKLLSQKTGATKFPFTVTALATAAIRSDEWSNPNRKNYISSRMYYTYQLMIARKFNEWISLQVTPTVVHRNLVSTIQDHNTIFSMGFGSSLKLTRSLRLNMEYYWVIPNQIFSTVAGEPVQDAYSVGLDLETGGHVFQLHFTNSRGMLEKFVASETTGRWLNGDIHFGFNVSRVFTIVDKDREKQKKKIKNSKQN